jgi:hypothetical protein
MSDIIRINQRQQRLDADEQQRSDAMNRTLIEAKRTINNLQADLQATRCIAGLALVMVGLVLCAVLIGGGV